MNTFIRQFKGMKRRKLVNQVDDIIALRKQQRDLAKKVVDYYRHKLELAKDIKRSRLPIEALLEKTRR